jgi:phosphoribosyl 1,2-cyclic phosphodiesterase
MSIFDHAGAVWDIMKAGVDVYLSAGTARALDLDCAHRFNLFNALAVDNRGLIEYAAVGIGSFWVAPFTVHHDAAEPVGFLLHSKKTGERLLFMTDSYYTEYRFTDLTHVMLEANYSNDALETAENRNRLRRSHMSIENCIEMLKANDLSHVKEIWLLHLSSSNGNGEEFKRRVQEATGCPVFIA